MPEQYELLYGFVHCRGKTTYLAGYAHTRTEAEAWLKKNREAQSPTVKVPAEDPVRYCRAALCPLKKQKPWFDIAISQKPEE
jgi:hypothetical protein